MILPVIFLGDGKPVSFIAECLLWRLVPSLKGLFGPKAGPLLIILRGCMAGWGKF